MKTYLNLGCGRRFHPAWTNIDFSSSGPGVLAHNLLKGIPAADGTADVIYHSHVLEHFSKIDGLRFMQECHRVLKPGGIVRVAVPDLERITRGYIEALDRASAGDSEWEHQYDWMMVELYDQVVRTNSGGEMFKYLTDESVPNEDFVVARLGTEARIILQLRTSGLPQAARQSNTRRVLKAIRHPSKIRMWLARKMLGSEAKALSLGQFRLGGEIHQWMYDFYSLSRLLKRCGFVDVVKRSAAESYIVGWTGFNLVTEPDGSTFKPDSLFAEGSKLN